MTLKTIFWATAALGAVLLAPAAKADTWYKLQSPHFIVYSNYPVVTAQPYIEKLEAYDDFLETAFPKTIQENSSRPPFVVYLTRNTDQLREVEPGFLMADPAREDIASRKPCVEGQANFTYYRMAGSENLAGIITDRDAYDYSDIFYDYMLDRSARMFTTIMPRWYISGLSTYPTTVKLHGKNTVFGQAPISQYRSLTVHTWIDYRRILTDQVTPPYDNVTTASQALEHRKDLWTYQGQTWLLTHYILSSKERLTAFAKYIDDVNAGSAPVTAFEQRFGIKVEDLQSILKKYLNGDVLSVSMTSNTATAMPSVQVTKMPDAADKLILLRASMETCQSASFNAGLLKQIRANAQRYPNDVFAENALARGEIVSGDPESVKAMLETHVSQHPDDSEAQYLLGRVYYHEGAPSLAKARAAFGKAYKLNPLDAPNLYYLSLSQDTANDTAINAAIEAATLEPAVSAYAFQAARLLITTDDLAGAVAALAPAASEPENGVDADKALAIIAAIRGGKSKADILAMF